ncbi:hypothetical protein HF283_07665 [Acidithiobacillus ferrooxidans]|uniref:hypothetical protein n=1 Tax=Acidithiobacillus ferridurans TaxID=1232575 RepID=UPI001C070ADE|nr:hypothetical protein [Acidithiobacillus ferridurans]MBU2806690.1 hypothetical protein [Acidithiobacillus ferridurans]MBU2823984.1 hypothetical protein [Acidithiobacillus ferrooxidans]
MNDEGFTWESIAFDLAELNYTYKALWHIVNGQPVPDASELKTKAFRHGLNVAAVRGDTDALLSDIGTLDLEIMKKSKNCTPEELLGLLPE